MNSRLLSSSLILTLLLSGCGGGSTTDPAIPSPAEDPLALEDAAAAAANAKLANAVSAFEKIRQDASNAPELVDEAPARCDPEKNVCRSAPSGPLEVAGIDMVEAAVVPQSTSPNGSAWLKKTVSISAVQGGEPSNGIDGQALINLKTQPIPALANPQDTLHQLSLISGSASAKVVDAWAFSNPHRVKYHYTKTTAKGTFKSGCSGTMIDSTWMLTAAHCVWSKDNTTNGGYVTSLYVTPGYENGAEPFGRAYATQILIPDYYKTATAADDDWSDFALIKLDRALGGITGWDGYSEGGVCDPVMLNSTMLNQAYPVSFPGTGGAFTFPGQSTPVNGKLMWEINFKFDKCFKGTGNASGTGTSQYVLNYPTGGGASGSAGLLSGKVRSLAVRSDGLTQTTYQGLYTGAVGMADVFLRGDGQLTSNRPDLVPASVRVIGNGKDTALPTETSPIPSFAVGEQVGLVTFVHNAAFYAPRTGEISYRAFMSHNGASTEFTDNLIFKKVIANSKLEGKKTISAYQPFTMPCPLKKSPDNIYYVGVAIDTGGVDVNPTNNWSTGIGGMAKFRLTGTSSCTPS